VEPEVQSLVWAAAKERNLELAVRGKDWDDVVWNNYIMAVEQRRKAVDKLLRSGIIEPQQQQQEEGFGL
jgi:hypothetical protein